MKKQNPALLEEPKKFAAPRRMNSVDWFEATTSFPENSTHIIPSTRELNVFYTICESLVALFAVVGNAIVIIVFRKERRLRRRTNYYIVSLAAADLLVGLLGIPFAILASVGLPTNLHACLFTVSLLLVLCTISIFCLVAVSVDRYWAILHPMGYSRHVRTKTALVIISICWVAGTIVGFLPLMGWHKVANGDVECYFLKVMDYNYLVFLYVVTIMTPALLLAAFYAHIYSVVLKQLRQIVTMNPTNGTTSPRRTPGGTMLRTLGAAQKREVKATQNLSIIVLFFMICWIPLYTINFILAFCDDCFKMNSTLMLFCIILSHLNSAGNPLLYAYHLKDFRAALKSFLLNLVGGKEQQVDQGLHQNGRLSLYRHSYYNQRRETRSALTLYPQNGLIPPASSNTSSLTTKSSSLPNEARITSVVSKTTTLAVLPTVGNRIWRISEVGSASEEPNKKRSGSSTTSSGHVNYAFAKGLETVGDDDVFYDNNSACISDMEEAEISIITNTLQRLRTDRIFSSSPHLAMQNSAPRFKTKVNRSYSVIEYKGSASSLEELQNQEMFQSTKHSGRELSDDSGAISDTNKDSVNNSSIGIN